MICLAATPVAVGIRHLGGPADLRLQVILLGDQISREGESISSNICNKIRGIISKGVIISLRTINCEVCIEAIKAAVTS